MPHHLSSFAAVFGILVATALVACGGSSSETPPPLQPDPAGFRYAPSSSRPLVEEADAGEAPRTNSEGAPDASAPARAPSGAAPSH